MDLLTTLRTARVIVFGAVLILLVGMGIRKRAQWWEIAWLVFFVAHQLAFTAFVLIAQWQHVEPNAQHMRAWSAAVDLHLGIAALTYLLVLARTSKNARRVIPDRGSSCINANQRIADIAAERERIGIDRGNKLAGRSKRAA